LATSINTRKAAITVYPNGEVRIEVITAVTAMYEIKVFADDEVVVTGNYKFIFAIPEELNQFILVTAEAYVSTDSSSGDIEIMIEKLGDSDMLLSPIIIDAGELSSYTSASPSEINSSQDDVATGSQISINVTDGGTAAKGLGVILRFDRPF
jgi:hypothetical protein